MCSESAGEVVWLAELLCDGTIVALLPSRHAALVLAGSKAPEARPAFAKPVRVQVALREGHD